MNAVELLLLVQKLELFHVPRHMAAIGHPIANDPRYGQRNERRLDAERLALHAGRLIVDDPTTGDPVRSIALWPKDLQTLGGTEVGNEWLEGL